MIDGQIIVSWANSQLNWTEQMLQILADIFGFIAVPVWFL